METILKEKKCKNCPICLEGINLGAFDQIDLITDLNKQIIQKTAQVDSLQEHVNQANKLVSDICSHNYQMLRAKTKDFLQTHDQLKQRFERRIMQAEDNLALESAKYQEIIKTRVQQLQDKIDEQRGKLTQAARDQD